MIQPYLVYKACLLNKTVISICIFVDRLQSLFTAVDIRHFRSSQVECGDGITIRGHWRQIAFGRISFIHWCSAASKIQHEERLLVSSSTGCLHRSAFRSLPQHLVRSSSSLHMYVLLILWNHPIKSNGYHLE